MTAPRLTIIIPYRDREEHLKHVLPWLARYFERDKLDHVIPYRVLVVEQEAGLPFNRGAIKNVGFMLAREHSDYVCFHDVDYTPVWTDYSYSDKPTAIMWYGADVRPISRTSRITLYAKNENTDLFGGALLVPPAVFEAVNGYANAFWGWGMEDIDLWFRFQAAKVACMRRKGTFQPLFHDSDGHHDDGSLNPVAKANQEIFARRWPRGQAPEFSDETRADGLSSLKYTVLRRQDISAMAQPQRPAIFEKVTVSLGHKPTPEQRAAHAAHRGRG